MTVYFYFPVILRALTLVQRVPGSIAFCFFLITFHSILLHLTCGPGGVVDGKDFAVRSDKGNARLFVHDTLGVMEEQC